MEQNEADAAHEQERQAAREKKVQETLEVVKRAVADSAGEGAISSAASSNVGGLLQTLAPDMISSSLSFLSYLYSMLFYCSLISCIVGCLR